VQCFSSLVSRLFTLLHFYLLPPQAFQNSFSLKNGGPLGIDLFSTKGVYQVVCGGLTRPCRERPRPFKPHKQLNKRYITSEAIQPHLVVEEVETFLWPSLMLSVAAPNESAAQPRAVKPLTSLGRGGSRLTPPRLGTAFIRERPIKHLHSCSHLRRPVLCFIQSTIQE